MLIVYAALLAAWGAPMCAWMVFLAWACLLWTRFVTMPGVPVLCPYFACVTRIVTGVCLYRACGVAVVW